MKISGISINGAEIVKVNHSSTTFSNSKATINDILIHFKSDKYEDKADGVLSIDRKQARFLMKEIALHLKVRKSKSYLRWTENRNGGRAHKSKKLKPSTP